MRAVRNTEQGIEVVEVDEPEPTGDEVAVRVAAAGICGSDLHLVEWGPMPTTLGHEVAGWTDDGTPVAIEPNRRCGTCERCARGDTHLCGHGAIAGVGLDGGMADRMVVPPECLVPLDPGVPVAAASLVEPVACSVHALRRAGLEAGQRAAVVGGGTLGLGAVAAAAEAGCEVGLVARHAHQTAAGEALGAVPAEGSYDLVVDAAGTASAIEKAVELATPGATVALLGTYWDGLSAPGLALMMKELTLVSSFAYGHHQGQREIEQAAALLASRPEIGQLLVTHRFGLDDAAQAFRVAADRGAGAIKVVLEP